MSDPEHEAVPPDSRDTVRATPIRWRQVRQFAWPLSFLGWVALFLVLFALRPAVAGALGGAVEQACFGARGGGRQCIDIRWTFTDAVHDEHPALTWLLGVPSLTWGVIFGVGIVCWIALAAWVHRRH